MLVGMALLLIAASAAIYTVQRRHLQRAFDDTLLNSANSLAMLIRPGPLGNWFDAGGLDQLPAGQIRQGALFQFWSDQPIDILPPRQDRDSETDATPDEEGISESTGSENPPSPASPGFLRGPPPGPRYPGFGPSALQGLEMRPPHVRSERVIRSPSLNSADLPRLEGSPVRPCFANITMPDNTPGRAVGLQTQLLGPPPGRHGLPPARLTTVVAASTAEIRRQLAFLAVLLAATTAAAMVVSTGVAWLVVGRGLRPLATAAQQIAALDETRLKQRILEHGAPREVAPVIRQLNGLLGRLDEAFDRERALTADVAHELRTPVAEIRAIAEIALARERDAGEYREALGETKDSITTLQGLIERLLVLARLEAGQARAEVEAVALHPFVCKHWTQIQCRAAHRGITFENLCPPETIVSADPGLLEVVLSNVLSNAVAYAAEGGRITAEARRVGDRCQLSVANTGCVLSEDEAARVFDRFWRADAARSGRGLNCGLGLTIVRRAMEAMGGQAEAGISQDRRFILSLTFDVADE